MHSEPGPVRLFSFDEHFLGPELSSNYGVEDFRTWDALDVLEHIYYLRLLQSLAAQRHPEWSKKLLDVADVKYVLAHRQDPSPVPGLSERPAKELKLLANPDALPRAVFYSDIESVPFNEFQDWRSAMQRGLPLLGGLLARGLDVRRTLVLTDIQGISIGPHERKPAIPAQLQDYRIDYARVKVEAPSSGFLFMSDTYFPGWEAMVDGKPASILRAWLNFRAVPLGAGKHSVEFVYTPWSLIGGALATILGLAVLLWFWARETCSRPPSECELLVMANVGFGLLYWGIWCAIGYRGDRWPMRLAGLALLAFLGLIARAALAWRRAEAQR